MRPFALILIAATASACTLTPAETAEQAQRAAGEQAGLQRELAGLAPGQSQSCLSNFQSTHLRAYGPVLVYRVSNGLKYRNDTAGGCENVARGDILVTVSNSGQLCQGDLARTVDQASRFPTGSCALGPFTRYAKP